MHNFLMQCAIIIFPFLRGWEWKDKLVDPTNNLKQNSIFPPQSTHSITRAMLKNKYQTFDLLIKFIGSTRLIDNNYHIIIKSLERLCWKRPRSRSKSFIIFYFIILEHLVILNLVHFPSTFNPYLCNIFVTIFSNKSRTQLLSHVLITLLISRNDNFLSHVLITRSWELCDGQTL